MAIRPTNREPARRRTTAVSPRTAPLYLLAAVVSLVSVLVLIGYRSSAAFSATTANAGNAFTAGTVGLSDDDSGSAIFSVSNLAPGDSAVSCIAVSYAGTISNPGPVRIYSGGYTDSATLASHLNLTIEEGTGGSFGSCTGFSSSATIESGSTLAAFGVAHTNYANGAGTWDPATASESRTYRVTIELDSGAPNSMQGESVTGLAFTWEVQS